MQDKKGNTPYQLSANKMIQDVFKSRGIATKGGLPGGVIRSTLLDHVPQFRRCYQRFLDNSENPFNGIGQFNFIISASGYVSKANVDMNTTIPTSVNSCIISVLKSLEFPKPRPEGTIVEVNQPFNFTAKRRDLATEEDISEEEDNYPIKEDYSAEESSCNDGDMIACYSLGFSEEKQGNTAEAKKLYKESCNGGYLLACYGLGFLEEKSGNIVNAKRLYKKSCDGGDMGGCSNLRNLKKRQGEHLSTEEDEDFSQKISWFH